MRTLIVIDMQPEEFMAARNQFIVNNILREIKKAKKDRYPIVILQYRGAGRTHGRIRRQLNDYDKVDYIWKDDDDGTYEVIESLRGNRFPKKNLIICGVNVDACVQRTVEGLAENLSSTTIEVVEDACGSDSSFYTFDWIRNLPNVLLREEIYDESVIC